MMRACRIACVLVVTLDRTLQIPALAVDLGDDGGLGKALGNSHGDVEGGGHIGGALLDVAVGKLDLQGEG